MVATDARPGIHRGDELRLSRLALSRSSVVLTLVSTLSGGFRPESPPLDVSRSQLSGLLRTTTAPRTASNRRARPAPRALCRCASRSTRESRSAPAYARRAAREPRRLLLARERDPQGRQHTADAVLGRWAGGPPPGRPPLVAVGVVQHSDYRRDLWRRLGRTLRALYLITYGTKAEAERAAEAVQTVHARVHGKTDVQLGPFPAGTSYSASDPALMLWVHATLVEAFALRLPALRAHTLTRRPGALLPRDGACRPPLRHARLHAPTLTCRFPRLRRSPGRQRDDLGHCAGERGGRGHSRRTPGCPDALAPPSSPAGDSRSSPAAAPPRIRTALEPAPRPRAPARRTLSTAHHDSRPDRLVPTRAVAARACRVGPRFCTPHP
jgi:hypothetical protein